MVKDRDIVINLIKERKENQIVDFKQRYYIEEKKYEIVKDISAFANANYEDDSYIIFGIEDTTRNICGIENIPDVSDIDQIIEENIEPFIDVEVNEIFYEDKRLFYLKIPVQHGQPYLVKKNINKKGVRIEQGSVFIRKGATIFRATRTDLEKMYEYRNRKKCEVCGKTDIQVDTSAYREIDIYRNFLDVNDWSTGKKKNDFISEGRFEVQIINSTDMPMVINDGCIKICNENDIIERGMYLQEGNLADSPLKILAKDTKILNMSFDFFSSDCITLIANENGNMLYNTTAQIFLYDVEGNEFISKEKPVLLTIRGSVLHKIKLYYKQFREYLYKNKDAIILCISQKQNEQLENYMKSINFKFIQPISHPIDIEYLISCRFIKEALDNSNMEALEIMRRRGLREEYIEDVRENSFRILEKISKL